MTDFVQPTGQTVAERQQQGDVLFTRRLLYRTNVERLSNLQEQGFCEVESINFLVATHFQQNATNWNQMTPVGAMMFQRIMRTASFYMGTAPSSKVVGLLPITTASYDSSGNGVLVMEPLLNQPSIHGAAALVIGYRLRVFARASIPRRYVEAVEGVAHDDMAATYLARDRRWRQEAAVAARKKKTTTTTTKKKAALVAEDPMEVEAVAIVQEEEEVPARVFLI
jgi:hypothetical protein